MSPDPMPPRNKHTKVFHGTELSGEVFASGNMEQAFLPSLTACFDELEIAHTPAEHTAAATFFNIPELRIMLYKEMANSKMNKVDDFSGLFLASKAIYSEAETEIVNLRKKYIAAEELKWSGDWGGQLTISMPSCYRDLNALKVMLPRRRLDGQNWRLVPHNGEESVLRDLALPCLEF